MKLLNTLTVTLLTGLSIFISFPGELLRAGEPLSLQDWTYIQVDSTRKKWGDWNKPAWLRSFGIDAADITGDGMKDIIAGRYFYRNPGGDMTNPWERSDLGVNVDGMLFVDVDGDQYGDVIAQALPDVYWMEALDKNGRQWQATRVAQLPPTDHVNGQGYALAQIIPGNKPEILMAADESVYYLRIPENPVSQPWPAIRIASHVMAEGIGVGDLNGDGLPDVTAGREIEKNAAYLYLWFENPGDGSGAWKEHIVSPQVMVPDRVVVRDYNGDGLMDIAISEERYPGKKPNASVYWFEHPGDATKEHWTKHLLITQYSSNNLDAADLDHDGDIDLVTSEHKGPNLRLEIFENDGSGHFTMHVIDRGKEMHLGARLDDLDGDGDLEIYGVPWDNYQNLHVWRNDAIQGPSVLH